MLCTPIYKPPSQYTNGNIHNMYGCSTPSDRLRGDSQMADVHLSLQNRSGDLQQPMVGLFYLICWRMTITKPMRTAKNVMTYRSQLGPRNNLTSIASTVVLKNSENCKQKIHNGISPKKSQMRQMQTRVHFKCINRSFYFASRSISQSVQTTSTA